MSDYELKRSISDIQSKIANLHHRSRDDSRAPDLASIVIKALVCQFLAEGRSRASSGGPTPEEIAQKIYRGDVMVGRATRDLNGFLARGAQGPATLTTPGYAAEMTITVNWPTLLGSLAPDSTYAALAARGLRVAFNGVSGVRLPAKLPAPLIGGDFIGEGAPIPTRRLGVTGITIVPHKMALISHFSDELRRSSVPSIEAVLRAGIAYDSQILLDQRMLDNVAATSIRPAGLLNGVTPLTPSAGGGLAAIAGDLSALATAITAPIIDLVYLMNVVDFTRALALAPGLNQLNNIIVAPALAAKTVIALDASDFVSAEGDTPRFDLSEQATIHAEDTTPLPIASVGTPNTVAAPAISMYQQDLISLRFIQRVTWMLGRPGRIAVTQNVTW